MNIARLPLVLALLAVVLLLAAGPGTRLDLWEFRVGFTLMRWAAYLGLAAAALGLAMLLLPRMRRRGAGGLVIAILVGLGVAYVPWAGLRSARALPPIHDITTDTARPPEFRAVLPLRANASNPVEYAGAEIADQQRAAYPDVRPLHMAMPVAQAFTRAEAAARAMGWDIVESDPASGRIEATDTTFWFGFKDDVVIRVEAEGSGSRIDVRSVSRVGGSDVGANAARIRAYLQELAGDEVRMPPA